MRRDPDEALQRFYDACGSADVPSTVAAPAPVTSLKWALLGPAAVVVMLAIVSGVPIPQLPATPSEWFMGKQIQALGLKEKKPDTRRSDLWRVQCDV